MRLFVALDLPWALRESLSDLAMGLEGVRWVPPENLHLTLRFISEAPRHVAEEIDLALASLRGRAFSLEIAGVGTREKIRPRQQRVGRRGAQPRTRSSAEQDRNGACSARAWHPNAVVSRRM